MRQHAIMRQSHIHIKLTCLACVWWTVCGSVQEKAEDFVSALDSYKLAIESLISLLHGPFSVIIVSRLLSAAAAGLSLVIRAMF